MPHPVRTIRVALVVAVAALLAATAPAGAHSGVTSRTPGKGASVGTVGKVSVTFSQQIRSGTLRVYRGDKRVGTGSLNPVVNVRRITAAVNSGRAGRYVARWRITAADGHTQRGSWSFRVT